jgi:hypothetical protein
MPAYKKYPTTYLVLEFKLRKEMICEKRWFVYFNWKDFIRIILNFKIIQIVVSFINRVLYTVRLTNKNTM